MNKRPAAGEPPEYILEKVRGALAEDPRVSELGLEVKLAGEKLFLTGSVPTDERRSAISEVAEEVCPGYEVHNETMVTPISEPTEVEPI